MLRKIMIATVASLSLLSPLALAIPAQAHERHERHEHFHQYTVFVRDCTREPWRPVGTYRHYDDAQHAACHLRERGLEAFVR